MVQTVEYDVVVVGSGPAGSTTARVAAERGLRVLLVDRRQELGSPIQCSGAVSDNALNEAGVRPNDEFVSTPIYGFVTYDTHGNATTMDYRLYRETPLGYVVDRRRFDRYLMTMAERAGVEVWLKTDAKGYTPHEDGTVDVHLNRFGFPQQVRTRVIVGADGLQSQVGKWGGLRTHIKLSELASCLQLVIDHVETDGLLEIVAGHEWAPGGYAWLFPKGHGYAEVGLGVIRTITDKDARWHLDHFMQNSFMAERLKNCRILEVQGGGVPLAAPLKKQVADNIILVGDAARHVNPITGGGIHTALRGGIIAGTFLGDFIPTGERPTAEALTCYHERWLDELGHAMWKLYEIKTDIFREQSIPRRDQRLYDTLASYFSPHSEFRKV
ncbi:MAG: NAD(P)/FAD-dependent oxidoreductase [Ardenticatenales bacterium]|nr:NAD(P)/FAD-dependent oxidoreductase [Ardenticatenales bacterium]